MVGLCVGIIHLVCMMKSLFGKRIHTLSPCVLYITSFLVKLYTYWVFLEVSALLCLYPWPYPGRPVMGGHPGAHTCCCRALAVADGCAWGWCGPPLPAAHHWCRSVVSPLHCMHSCRSHLYTHDGKASQYQIISLIIYISLSVCLPVFHIVVLLMNVYPSPFLSSNLSFTLQKRIRFDNYSVSPKTISQKY